MTCDNAPPGDNEGHVSRPFKAAAGTTAAGRVTRATAGTEITMAAATNSGSYPTRSTRAHGDRGGLTDDQDHVRAR